MGIQQSVNQLLGATAQTIGIGSALAKQSPEHKLKVQRQEEERLRQAEAVKAEAKATAESSRLAKESKAGQDIAKEMISKEAAKFKSGNLEGIDWSDASKQIQDAVESAKEAYKKNPSKENFDLYKKVQDRANAVKEVQEAEAKYKAVKQKRAEAIREAQEAEKAAKQEKTETSKIPAYTERKSALLDQYGQNINIKEIKK